MNIAAIIMPARLAKTSWVNMMNIAAIIIKFLIACFLIIAFLKLGGCYAEQYTKANKQYLDAQKQLIIDHENDIKANWVKE